ncbi:UDP-N-acetylmuramoyl-L-alanine--D-glutamate ligase [Paraliomyxa miuraensis]|uniref:UDP-N-acetylmuramoyl-L-alanine--D-glutamate ligase n=1 Tax=Paraliomyxa miuraensis TaxID=376150 RepID=UPI0022529AD3|nr:UDP-N-acetylmuramoyl-L-alanine--D-glutamate ligase [Paraliomyxa miuraensis]MCX4241477.1 UDP-N-acetylmuramoyl-L-alanine--D-glutamate ligase [Paraliomyxa miuraensis]
MSTTSDHPTPGPQARAPWNHALVIGLGRSGLAAVDLLVGLGVRVRGYDARESIEGLPVDLSTFLGMPQPPDAAFEGIDLLVLSPGVPPQEIRRRAERLAPSAAIHGELSLAMHLVCFGGQPQWPAVPTVLVTGTNGKSTVTALTGALLQADGRHPFVGGNLGVPLCERLLETLRGAQWIDSLVLECSSYQLETLPPVPTDVAMIINVTPDHLDRYASMEEYARTKARIFGGLGATGLALLDADDEWTDRLAPPEGSGQPSEIPTGAWVARVGDPKTAVVEDDGAAQQLVLYQAEKYPRSSLRIAGGHNARNALFALLAARHLGVSAEACQRGLERFEGLPHRMVRVRELDGVVYYDDSKATNVTSALAGLRGLERPFVLIAGGLSKGDDLTPLREVLARQGRGLVAVGKAAEEFAAMAEGVVPVVRAGLMDDAVPKARALAKHGEAVVLAPACASFDQYKSYAQRGEMFTAAVLGLE